jgi:fatty acid desaturase
MMQRNDIDRTDYREVAGSDWRRMFLYILGYSVMLIAASALLLPENWLLWLAVIALGTYLLIV